MSILSRDMFFLYALIGAVAAAFLACVPALHIYNVAALLLLLDAGPARILEPEAWAAMMLGLVSGYAMLNTLTSIFMSAPDESTLFIVLPGQKYLLQRRGWEAVVLTGAGSLGGVAFLALLAPLTPQTLALANGILAPHIHWILAAVTSFVLLSEWPKGTDRAGTTWGRLADGWRSLGAGLLTFVLSGLLGFILLYRSPIPAGRAYQNLAPAFIGLFAIPQLLLNLVSRVQVPPQHIARSVDVTWPVLVRGTLAGAAGGLFAAFFPIVTGGIGGLIAGHATAQRDDRLFLISQGASKAVYYAGALLLFFVPGLHLTRGGMAWMLSSVYTPYRPEQFHRAMAAVLLCSVLSFFLLLGLARLAVGLVARVSYGRISAGTLALLAAQVAVTTGPAGLLVAAVATGIGLIPPLLGSRRMNALGLVLLPMTLNLAGLGDRVAGWLGLL